MLDTLEKNKELLKFNAEGKEPKDIFAEALLAGRNAVEEYHAKHGEHEGQNRRGCTGNGGAKVERRI